MITSKEQLLAMRVLLAVTEAFYIPASLAIVADYHAPATRAKAVATLIIGMSLGPILGGAAAGWIGDNYGWRPVMYVLGGVGLLLALVLAAFLRDARVGASDSVAAPAPRRAGVGETVAEILRTPSVVAIMLGVGVFSFGGWMLITWLPLFLVDKFEFNLAQSGFFGNLAVTGPLLIGSLCGGVFSDYLGANRPARRMLLLLGFYVLSIPWPLAFSVATTASAVLGSVFLFQLCRMLGELNSHPLIFDLVSPEKRSTAVGISNCVNTFLGGVGAQIVGEYKASLGFQTVFGLVPIVIALSVGGLLLAYFTTLDRDLKRRGTARSE
jgi:predicted MFS family arabinose efflux permease